MERLFLIEGYIINNKLKIIVKANSSKNEIKGFDVNRKALRVNIKAKPEQNKANIEIIKFFKKLGYNVNVIKGFKNKVKVLRIYA